jgi:hypothetical protein
MNRSAYMAERWRAPLICSVWRRELLLFILVLAAFCFVTMYSHRSQHVTLTRFGDGDEYFFAAEQLAAGDTVRAEAPYVYRIGLPWLVARLFPHDIAFGFLALNVVCAASITMLLLVWLRSFSATAGTRAVIALMFIASWLGPARFVHFYPIYVDPPFMLFALVGLMVIDRIRGQVSWRGVVVLSIVCFIGTLFRETMIFVAFAFAVVNVGFGHLDKDVPKMSIIHRALPLIACAVAIAICRMQPFEPRRSLSAVENALYLFGRKPLFTLPLAAFITFGPVVALAAYDWRQGRRLLAQHSYLMVYTGGCFVAGYVGGHETERYWIWAAPVVYVLIAKSIERHRKALLSNAWVFVALVAAQGLSERVLWSIPDPGSAVARFEEMNTLGEKVYAILNRLFVIDDFYWNLWSYFGSRPFHAAQLGLYICFSAFLLSWIYRAENISDGASTSRTRDCRP